MGNTEDPVTFLRSIYQAAREGDRVSIQQDGTGNTITVIRDIKISYNAPVLQVGTQIIGGLRELDDLLDIEQVTRASLRAKLGEEVFSLLAAEKGQFLPPYTVDETPKRLLCDIFDFNKYDSVGKARVAPDQLIPPGNYKFKNIGAQAVEDFILSMTETQVTLNCLVKTQNDPLVESRLPSCS